MAPAEFVNGRYVTITGTIAVVERPFLPTLKCQVKHFHQSHCRESSRSCFLDSANRVVYCTDRGLKGGGAGGSKVIFHRTAEFYESSEQQRAIEHLEQALKYFSPALAHQSCEVLFDCHTPAMLMHVVEIVTRGFKTSDRLWAWTGTAGHLARIGCARLLRTAARVMMSEIQASVGVAIMSDDQKQYSAILENSVKRIVSQAKQTREIVLQAELRASWAIISSLKNERDIRDWIKDYGPDIAGLAALFDPARMGLGVAAVMKNATTLYTLMQRKRDRSLSRQLMLLAGIDFAVRKTTLEDVQLVGEIIRNCKRWVTAVLCAALLRKWLANPQDLNKNVYDMCIGLLHEICSFKTFVFRSNWKVRSGGLWNVAVLHESTRLMSLRATLSEIISERKTVEKDIQVLGPLEYMDSFRSARTYLETQEVYGSILEKELHGINTFITTCKQHLNTEQSEIDDKNYHAIIKKELEKVSDTYKEMSLQNIKVMTELKSLNELLHILQSMLEAQTTLIRELMAAPLPTAGKIVSLPKMTLVDECFFGRFSELHLLRTQLRDSHVSKSIALIGAECMGKSWLAIKYAKICQENYDIIVYLQADSASSIYLSLIAIAKELQCEKCSDKETLDAVKRKLEHRSRVLLIYDNADCMFSSEANQVETMIEYMSLVFRIQGHILLTSRSPMWKERMDVVEVVGFREQEAIELIRDTAGASFQDAQLLAEELDCVPLAVKQAAKMLSRKKGTVSDFLIEFREKKQLSPSIVTNVLDICLNSLTTEAKELMEMMALLNGSFIPMDIVKGLKQKMTDVSLISILSELRSADFIDVTSHGVIINRSFQELAQRLCKEKEQRQKAVSSTLTDLSNSNNCGYEVLLNARPYVEKKETVLAADVLIEKRLADRYLDLELLYEEDSMRIKQVEDCKNPLISPAEVVISLIDSARRYFRCNKVAEGETDFHKALEAANDDLVLRVHVKAAHGKIASKSGDFLVADRILTEAIALTASLDGEFPLKELADLYMSFALVKMELKDDSTAHIFFRRALKIREKDLSAEREVAEVLVNYAFFFQTSSMKSLGDAESLYLRALQLNWQESDRQLELIYRNLAIVYGEKFQASRDQRFVDKKLEYLLKALDFRKRFFNMPAIDPDTAQIFLSLADVYIVYRDWNATVNYFEQALEKFGANNPLTPVAIRRIEAAKFYRDHPEISAGHGSN